MLHQVIVGAREGARCMLTVSFVDRSEGEHDLTECEVETSKYHFMNVNVEICDARVAAIHFPHLIRVSRTDFLYESPT